MRFTTKTEYGLFCLIFMAKNHADVNPITVKDIAKDEHYSLAYAEKILQTLRLANIVTSFHGNQGGYILARHPSEITLKEIVEALEEQTFDVFCEPDIRKDIVCNHFPSCGVRPIWERTKELINNYYQSITLEMIAKNEIKPAESLKINGR
ncbi:MAG: Rrf2 family transcriptional regulator [Candidatus Omnitrophica bacterium]|nr:Rrf2 family transcriptional regulator [Candidatus Omnitrophota bacterium]